MSYSFSMLLKDFVSSKIVTMINGLNNLERKIRSSQTNLQNKFDKSVISIDNLNAKLQKLNAQRTAATSINDIRRLKTEINRTEREIRRLENLPPDSFRERLRSIGGQFGGLIGLAGGVGLALQAWNGIKSIFNKGVELEQSNIKFEVLMGSAERAKQLLGELARYADTTPYGLDGLQKGAETMLGFGIAQEKILPNMKMLGDIAMGNEEKLAGLSLVYSQIQATGKLMGQDLLQLINQGFNPLQVISEQTGLSIGTLKERMSKGGVSAKELAQAFEWATDKQGQFYQGAEKAGQTLAGRWGKMLDSLTELSLKVYDMISPIVVPLIDLFTFLKEKEF